MSGSGERDAPARSPKGRAPAAPADAAPEARPKGATPPPNGNSAAASTRTATPRPAPAAPPKQAKPVVAAQPAPAPTPAPDPPVADDATEARTQARALPRVAQTKSIVGSFDAIDHGYEAAGWVFDISRPTRHCRVQLRVDGVPVAEVEAAHPRPDLEIYRIRAACGFRITIPAAAFDGVIHAVECWLPEDSVKLGPTRALACVISDHKTYPKEFSVNSILRLEDGAIDYDRIFSNAFLQQHGIRAAVAYAYLWLLKRPPDRGGWDAYSDRILSGEIGIGTCMRELAGSEEAAKARRAGVDLRAEFEAVVAAAARLPGGGGRKG